MHASKLAKTLFKLIRIPGNTDLIFLGYFNSRNMLYVPMIHWGSLYSPVFAVNS